MWHLTLTSICSLWYYAEMCLSGRAINMWRLRALLLSSVCTNVLVVFVDTIAAVAVVVCVDCALCLCRGFVPQAGGHRWRDVSAGHP